MTIYFFHAKEKLFPIQYKHLFGIIILGKNIGKFLKLINNIMKGLNIVLSFLAGTGTVTGPGFELIKMVEII